MAGLPVALAAMTVGSLAQVAWLRWRAAGPMHALAAADRASRAQATGAAASM